MKDMSAAAGCRARRDHGLDGALLCLGTTGMQVGLVPVKDVVRSIERHPDVPQQLGELGVHDQETVERGDLLHRRTQLPEIQHRELVHARRAQEGLEPEHSGIVQIREGPETLGNGPSPEPDIHVDLPVGG